MEFALQIAGGGFFLLNKILLSIGERVRLKQWGDPQKWRVFAWISYIIGLPPWIVIFYWERNWIAASVELSGLPAMVMGLIITINNGDLEKAPRWLDWVAWIAIPLGFGISFWDFGGFTSMNQWLEIGLVLGYVIGTYLIAKQKYTQGYLWYVLMHVSCGALMWVQSYNMLMWMQIISLIFILDAYNRSRRI